MWMLLALSAFADPWAAPAEPVRAFKPTHPTGMYLRGDIGLLSVTNGDTGLGADFGVTGGYRSEQRWAVEVGLGPAQFTFTEWMGTQGQAGAHVLGGYEARYFGVSGGVAVWWTPNTVRPWAMARVRFGAVDGGMFQAAGAWGGEENGAGVDLFTQLPFKPVKHQLWWTARGTVRYLNILGETGLKLRLAGDNGPGSVFVSAAVGLSSANRQFGPHGSLAVEARL